MLSIGLANPLWSPRLSALSHIASNVIVPRVGLLVQLLFRLRPTGSLEISRFCRTMYQVSILAPGYPDMLEGYHTVHFPSLQVSKSDPHPRRRGFRGCPLDRTLESRS